MPERESQHELAVRVTAIALPGTSDREQVSVPAETWPDVLRRLSSERLTGLALAGAQRGQLLLTDGQCQDLLDQHRHLLLPTLALEQALITVSSAFRDVGVEHVVLKGPALAHSFYPDPTLRPFVDLDLLVRTRDWRRACTLLEKLGYLRIQPEPRAGFDERFGKAAPHRSDEGLCVDLHRTLVVGPFGLWLDPDELFELTSPLFVAGRMFRRLDDAGTLLHACMHASLGLWPPLLLPIRDVAQVATVGNVDWGQLLERTRRWRLHAVVRHAFQTVTNLVGLAPPEQVRDLVAEVPTALEQRALAAYFGETRPRALALAMLLAIPGIRGKGAYVRARMLPQRDFLSARAGPGYQASHLRRWMVPLRWLTSRSR